MKTAGIVGLGVMGASFAKALKNLGYTVYGMDIDPATLDYALENGFIDAGSLDPAELAGKCSLLIFALYPTKIAGWLEAYQDILQPGALLLEISGVKSHVSLPLQDMLRDDLELLSVHPMCGRESRGIAFADPAIFKNANFILVPVATNSFQSIVTASSMAKELGCKNISVLSIEEHDAMIAFLSQLTHVIAVSLMNTHENSHLVEYTGDSFRDLTRIAKINEDMWPELFLLNKEKLLEEIDAFSDSIQNFRNVLEREDTKAMKELFIQSTNRRKKFDQ